MMVARTRAPVRLHASVICFGVCAIVLSLLHPPPVVILGDARLVKNATAASSSAPDFPELVWLLSFPNSGTTYTLKSIQALSGTTTATNYGALEVDAKAQVSLGGDGPFLRFPDRPLPSHYLLTKTHCDRRPFPNASFPTRCRTLVSLDADGDDNSGKVNTTKRTVYQTPVRRAIHLIRSPMDNILAKWNYFRKTQQVRTVDDTESKLYRFTQHNFTRWCQYLDLEAQEQHEVQGRWNASFYAAYIEPLPCALDYVRYYEWHRSALAELALEERMVIHYEDYPLAMDRVLEFLDIIPTNNRYRSLAPVYARKNYSHSVELKRKVRRLGEAMCDPATLRHFERYFVS